jgi:hypothetical protein
MTGADDDDPLAHDAVRRLFRRAQSMPRLEAEIARARREFLGGGGERLSARARAAGEGRFMEWYVLERESEVLGATALATLSRADERRVREELEQSQAGVYAVEELAGELRLRDLQDGEQLEIGPSEHLRAGDVLIGRLYAASDGLMTPSPFAVVHRDAARLASAFQRDLARLDLDRRLTQAELEQLLFRRFAETLETHRQRVSVEQLEAKLEALLEQAGFAGTEATAVSGDLKRAVEGPGHVMGPLLERFAFESDVDLEQARRLLLELWNEHQLARQASALAADAGPGARSNHEAERAGPHETLGAAVARRIENGLREHRDIESLFDEIAELLDGEEEGRAEEDGGDGDEEEPVAGDAVDDEGDLEALVREYVWEMGEAAAPHRGWLEALAAQQRERPVPNLYLEAVSSEDLLRFLFKIFLGAPPDQRSASVHAAFDALAEFYLWAERTQDYAIVSRLEPCRTQVMSALERIHEASLRLSSEGRGKGTVPTLLRVTAIEDGDVEVAGHLERGSVWVAAPAGAAARLEIGDLILGAVERAASGPARFSGMVLVLPGAAEALLG